MPARRARSDGERGLDGAWRSDAKARRPTLAVP